MNNIAYLTSFGVLNAHFKSFSVPSRHRYIVCMVSLLSKRCSQTYLVLKGDPSSIISSPEPSGSQGELIVYPYSGVRCRRRCRRCRRRCRRRQQCLNIFSSETALPIKAKFYVEPPWEGGTKSLYKWFRSHDQDGRHAHIW